MPNTVTASGQRFESRSTAANAELPQVRVIQGQYVTRECQPGGQRSGVS